MKDKTNIDLIVLLLGIFSFLIPFCNIAGFILYFFSNKKSIKSLIGMILCTISLTIFIIGVIAIGYLFSLEYKEQISEKIPSQINSTSEDKLNYLKMTNGEIIKNYNNTLNLILNYKYNT